MLEEQYYKAQLIEFHYRFSQFHQSVGAGFYRFYYEVYFATRHRRMRPASVRGLGTRTHKRLMVNDPARMGQYPFLSGPFVCHFDDYPYHSALELDKKLFQITPDVEDTVTKTSEFSGGEVLCVKSFCL